MHIGIAILSDIEMHNIARSIMFNINKKYDTDIERALLPQHISLKQSFPYDGDIGLLESYFNDFFARIKPFKILIEKIEIQELAEEVVLGWLKIKESNELRDIHTRLCKELKSKFDIEPLGFDGDRWQFHSTLVCSTINKANIANIISDYHNKDISLKLEANEVVMFCCLGDIKNPSQWFSLKRFTIG